MARMKKIYPMLHTFVNHSYCGITYNAGIISGQKCMHYKYVKNRFKWLK